MPFVQIAVSCIFRRVLVSRVFAYVYLKAATYEKTQNTLYQLLISNSSVPTEAAVAEVNPVTLPKSLVLF